jgi:hypothetical protein
MLSKGSKPGFGLKVFLYCGLGGAVAIFLGGATSAKSSLDSLQAVIAIKLRVTTSVCRRMAEN